MNTLQKSNYNNLDLFKFIMSIFVVVIHTFPWGNYENSVFINALDLITTIAVPFFFLTSGYLLASKFDDPYASERNRDIVARRIKQFVKMYLTWTAIYFPLAIYSYVINDYSVPYSILVTLRKLVFRGENFNSWMLWYLLSTIYALILIWITMKLKFKLKQLAVSSCLFLVLIIAVNTIALSERDLNAFLGIAKTVIKYTITDGRVLNGLVYIPLGIYFFSHQKLIKYASYLLIPCFALSLFIENSWLGILLKFFLYIGVFSFILKINLKDNKIYRILRTSSTAIYFTHMYIYSAFCFIVYRSINPSMSGFIISLITVIVVSIVYAVIKERKKLNRNKFPINSL